MSDRYAPPRDLDEKQRRVANAITAGLRGEIPGPLAMWLWQPELADRAQRLGEYARYRTSIAPTVAEIAILTVARHWCSEFEWYAHKQIALEAGVAADVIECIRVHREPQWQSPAQAVVHEFATALLKEQRVGDAVYAQAIELLGTVGVVDLVGILGYYSMISMTINVFDVPLPPGVEPELQS